MAPTGLTRSFASMDFTSALDFASCLSIEKKFKCFISGYFFIKRVDFVNFKKQKLFDRKLFAILICLVRITIDRDKPLIIMEIRDSHMKLWLWK